MLVLLLLPREFRLLYALPESLHWYKQLDLDLILLPRELQHRRLLSMPKLNTKVKGGRGSSR